jgi:hypothetical protein
MSKYILKVLISALFVVTIAAAAHWFRDTESALAVGACGVIVIVNRHICRCPSCGSWRTAKTKQLLSDDYYPHAVACERRHCNRCGKETPLREYTVFF